MTLRVGLLALADAAGMALLAMGAFYLLRDTPLLVAGFPESAAQAWLALVLGLLMMFLAVAGILRELMKQTPPDDATRP